MANIGFISLGCAKNQVDCERMMYRIQEAGHTVQPDVIGCDVVIINTCGFIDSAKAEAIDFILQMAQLKAEGLIGKILVTGCLSQRYQQQIMEEMPEVDGILGTGNYTEVVDAVDSLLRDAVELTMSSGSASASSFQRRYHIGYSRAGRLLDTMEQLGIVGPPQGSKPREILVTEAQAFEIMDNYENQ